MNEAAHRKAVIKDIENAIKMLKKDSTQSFAFISTCGNDDERGLFLAGNGTSIFMVQAGYRLMKEGGL